MDEQQDAMVTLEEQPAEQRDNVLTLVTKLSPLEQNYMAQRILEPHKTPVEIMHELKVPQDAYHRWRFPALVEEAIANMVPGLSEALARAMLERHMPKAAAKLISHIDSSDERISIRAAERILEGQGVLKRGGDVNVNVGGDHRSISVRAAELWGQQHGDGAVTEEVDEEPQSPRETVLTADDELW